MSDPTQPGDAAGADDADDADGSASTYLSLGVAFGMLGLVLMLTLDETRIAGLPFLVLGITYSVLGLRPATRTDPEAPDGDGSAPAA